MTEKMSEEVAMRRYALYFAPAAGTPLDRFGREWLGRDARSGDPVEPELPPEISRESWLKATEAPRRYGFHATLKPPFRLAEGKTLGELQVALEGFVQGRKPFTLPLLKVGRLGRFLALILSEPSSELHHLAAECVTLFDHFRPTPEPDDIDRRMSSAHTPEERENLLRWGYPYVLDTWKFHMTLTGSLQQEQLDIFEPHLRERCRAVCAEPLPCDAVYLFEEPAPNSAFRLIGSYPLCSR